jgi:glyoxylase-like metal-dependent hydrolase (beta-lactamase superfamily II)
MFVKGLIVGALQANAYIAGCPAGKVAAVIDPGGEAERIVAEIASLGYEVCCILITHGHYDHIGGLAELKKKTGAPVMIHTGDASMLTNAGTNLSLSLGRKYEAGMPDRELNDGDVIRVGEHKLEVYHTPGHTPGSVCFAAPGLVFSGDTLFAGSIGRTDFPGGSLRQLMTAIKRKLLPLPDDTVVYPGHGPDTTIGEEREQNPFLTGEW